MSSLQNLLERSRTPHDGRIQLVQRALAGGATIEQAHRGNRNRPLVPGPAVSHQRACARVERPPVELTAEMLAEAKRAGFSDRQIGADSGNARGRRTATAACAWRSSGLQDRRHLRCGICRRDPVPLLDVRRGERSRTTRPTGRHHSRKRAQPHRSGDRVRLLVRSRRTDLARCGLRDGDGQLQSRDGVDRLRHQRSPLLRTAHASKTFLRSSMPSVRSVRSPVSSSNWAVKPHSVWRSG